MIRRISGPALSSFPGRDAEKTPDRLPRQPEEWDLAADLIAGEPRQGVEEVIRSIGHKGAHAVRGPSDLRTVRTASKHQTPT